MGNILLAPVGVLLTAVYPAWITYKCVEHSDSYDSGKWLTYWIIFACCYAVDEVLGFLLNWIPLYHTIKSLFLCGCAYFGGAQIVYTRYLKPYLHKREAQIDEGFETGKGWFNGKLKGVTQKATAAGKQYISENGEDIMAHLNVDEDNNGMMNGLTGDLAQQL
jgi:hypothetical protein